MRIPLKILLRNLRRRSLVILILFCGLSLSFFQNCSGLKSTSSSESSSGSGGSATGANLNDQTTMFTDSLLKFAPGSQNTADPEILVSTFTDEEVSAASIDGSLAYDQRSSLQQAIGQGSGAVKAKLQQDFNVAFGPSNNVILHPYCVAPRQPNLTVYTYVKPYTYRQADFLAWLKANAPVQDVLPPAARKVNGYLGNQNCPWQAGSDLTKTFGMNVESESSQVSFRLDNTLNPWRWNGPVNTIHAVEQPSLAVVAKIKDATALAQTQQALASLRKNNGSRHLLLDYQIKLDVSDRRTQLGENSQWDIYGGVHPQSATDLFGITHWFAYLYGQANGVYEYMQKRYLAPSVQLSLMVNLREDGKAWLMNEFMLSSLNYESTTSQASSNQAINKYIFEGGSHTNLSWYRLRMDAFKDPALRTDVMAHPVILSGGEFTPIVFTGNQFQTTFSGSIDLSAYDLVAHKNGFFPGQTINLEQNYGDNNSVNWIGVIAENHGPFVVDVVIQKLNLRVQSGLK